MKKSYFLLVLLILAVGVVFGWYLTQKRTTDQLVSPLASNKEEEKFDFDWVKWQDPAGFSFEYAKEIAVNPHPEDKTNYANLELTSVGREGKLTILCNDSPYADIDDWLAKDNLVSSKASLTTQLASISARRVALGSGVEVVGMIDWDRVLYLIKLEPETDESYWQPVYRHLSSTFKLIPLAGENEEQFTDWLKGFDTAGVDVVEGVEIIE